MIRPCIECPARMRLTGWPNRVPKYPAELRQRFQAEDFLWVPGGAQPCHKSLDLDSSLPFSLQVLTGQTRPCVRSHEA
jgi:hypothetical protein